MRIKLILMVLTAFLCGSAFAGKVSIIKSSSLVQNDLFDAKRARAKEYKQREKERNQNNSEWSTNIDPSCGLWRNTYLVYMCGNGRYYKGYETNEQIEYRELSTREIKELRTKNPPSKNMKK